MALLLFATDYIWEQSDVRPLYWKPGRYHDNTQGDIMITPQTLITPQTDTLDTLFFHHWNYFQGHCLYRIFNSFFGLFWIRTIFLAGASALKNDCYYSEHPKTHWISYTYYKLLSLEIYILFPNRTWICFLRWIGYGLATPILFGFLSHNTVKTKIVNNIMVYLSSFPI